MITFNQDGICFNYRVAGIAIHDNHVLLNHVEDYTFWFLPGGRAELRETPIESLRREMREELGKYAPP